MGWKDGVELLTIIFENFAIFLVGLAGEATDRVTIDLVC